MEEVSTIAASSFVAVYDDIGDVMYVNDGSPRVAETMAEDDGFLWRYDYQTHALIGFTIEDFSRYNECPPHVLANRIYRSLPIDKDELIVIVEGMLSAMEEGS